MSINAINSAVNSIETASNSAAKIAQNVANFSPTGSDLARAFVGTALDSNQIKADAAVIKTQDQVQQSILNLVA